MSRVKLAFAAAVLVASAIYAALSTCEMALTDSSNLNTPINNLIRFGLILIWGLPVAAVAAAVLGVPAYFLVKNTNGVTVASTIASGIAVGLVVSLAFAHIVPRDFISSAPTGISIGAVSSAVWWLVARRTLNQPG